MADIPRYCKMAQAILFNKTGTATGAPIRAITTATDIPVTVAGTFDIWLTGGTYTTATVTSDGWTITGGPTINLTAGVNTITVAAGGSGNIHLNIVPTTGSANWVNSGSPHIWSTEAVPTAVANCDSSAPTSDYSAIFNANSFGAANQTVTVDAIVYCLNMDWTGATNTPDFKFTASLYCYGNVELKSMTVSGGACLYFTAAGNKTFKTNGVGLTSASFGTSTTGGSITKLTLLDSVVSGYSCNQFCGELDLAGYSITVNKYYSVITVARSLTNSTGTGTLNLTTIVNAVEVSGTDFTCSGTIVVNIASTGALVAGNFSYPNTTFNLTGTAHTVSGNFSCANLNLAPTGASQTVTLTAANRVTCTSFTTSASKTITVQSSTHASTHTLASLRATSTTLSSTPTYYDILRNYNGVIVVDSDGTGGGTFAGANGSYTSLTMQGSGAYALTISGSNVFGTMTIDRSAASKTLTITDSATQTFTEFICYVSGTNTLTIGQSGAGAQPIFIKSGTSIVNLDRLILDDVLASPSDPKKWFYGYNSTVTGTTTGWFGGNGTPNVQNISVNPIVLV